MIYAIIKAGTKGKLRWFFIVITAIIGLLFISFLIANIGNIIAAEWAQILLTLGLVTVTAVYAWSTYNMANEMREQRYNTARPIIDIQRVESGESLLKEGEILKSSKTPTYLTCKFVNIGIGPAIDLYSFIYSNEIHDRWNFGTLAKDKETENVDIFLDSEESLNAYYRDIYGRSFKSSRKLLFDKTNNRYKRGPLQVTLLKEDELP